MKNIVRLGVVSALLLGTSLPASAQYSNADMGFAEPTAQDVGYQGLVTRGYGGNNSTQGGAYAGANDGDQQHFAEKNSDRTWFDQNRETQQYLINLPYRQSSHAKSQTKQNEFQRLTNGVLTSTQLLSNGTVNRSGFQGPQSLGFRGTGAPTIYALRHRIFAPITGTGSIKTEITSANGKD